MKNGIAGHAVRKGGGMRNVYDILSMGWINLVQDRDRWRDLLSTVMKLRFL
jgi:hypothetical protein